jgi:DNA-binding NarL/FixJ family response regulator
MASIKILAIAAHRQLISNFALLTQRSGHGLDITTVVTNFTVGFDPFITLTAKPDLIMLSVGLPGLDGLMLIKSIRTVNCSTPILVCCSCYAKAEFETLFNYDIQGIVTTNDTPEELAAAIQETVNREPGIFERQYRHAGHTMLSLIPASEKKLSEREITVL